MHALICEPYALRLSELLEFPRPFGPAAARSRI
jgi:hypothetical protein